ncbi:hypothetical protein T484DRAFT_1846891 [Baffinella frigidus]|nr:hypothetical protein T484DRAFT_1846891 [Cryptophyta sp. CCMP2293]
MSFADSHREGFGNRKGGVAVGAGAGAGAGTDAGGSGEFAAQASVARANIAQLLANINTVQRLSSALGGTKDTVELRERLHHVIGETKLLCADSKAVGALLTETKVENETTQSKRGASVIFVFGVYLVIYVSGYVTP